MAKSMKPKINRPLFILMILLVSLMFGVIAKAERQETIFLPVLSSSQAQSPSMVIEQYPANGLLAAMPLDNGELLVITLNGQNFVSYAFGSHGEQSFIDGWEVGGIPEKIEIVGCGWVVAQISPDNIQVHKSALPFESDCK